MKWMFSTLIILIVAFQLQAQVSFTLHFPETPTTVADPATIDPLGLTNGIEIVSIEGTSYFKIPLNGWNSWTSIPEAFIPDGSTNLKFLSKVDTTGTTIPVDSMVTFVKFYSPGWVKALGDGSRASQTEFSENMIALYAYGSTGIMQVAVQQRPDWNAITSGYAYLGKVETVGTPVYHLSFSKSGGNQTIAIDTDLDWTLTSNQAWLTANQASGSGDAQIILSAPAYSGGTIRTGVITLEATGCVPQTIEIIQTGILTVSAGQLSSLPANQLENITELTLQGTLDARDFKTMRDLMPNLASLDLEGTNILEYTGTEGPAGTNEITYPAGQLPERSFCTLENTGKTILNNLVLPATLTSIGSYSLLYCTGLTGITIPNTVTIIGRSAFNGCSQLSAVLFESSSQLNTIGIYGFRGTAISSITIPASVTLFDTGAFVFCSSLNTIDFETGSLLSTINTSTFRGCSNLSSVTLPAGVAAIGNYAFADCSTLSSINFESSDHLTELGSFVFLNCPALASFTLFSSVETLGNNTFLGSVISITVESDNPNFSSLDGVLYNKDQSTLYYCPSTKTGTFSIPQMTSRIGIDAFYNCSDLTSITLPLGVEWIDEWAFENCTRLTLLNLPSTVKQIGSNAFYNCIGLTSLYVNSSVPVDLSSADNVFYGVDVVNCTLYVPQGTSDAYRSASQWQTFSTITEKSPLSLSVSKIDFGKNGGSVKIGIESIVNWAAGAQQDWLYLQPVPGAEYDSLVITATANPGNHHLIGSVSFSAPGCDNISLQVVTGIDDGPYNKDWNISDIDFNALGTINQTQKIDDLTLYATSESPMTVDANNKSIDGINYTNRLKLSGTGSFYPTGLPLARVLSVKVPGNSTLMVTGMSASSSSDRTLIISTDTGEEVGRFTARGTYISKEYFNYIGQPVTLYLYSESSGINLYHISLVSDNVQTSSPVKVAYFTFPKEMDASAAGYDSEPILQMLNNDVNLEVDLKAIANEDDTSPIDLSSYQVVVVQESFSSTADILSPDGPLGLAQIDKPFVYNKSFAIRDGRALSGGNSGLGAEKPGVLSLFVDPQNQNHTLFTELPFIGDSTILFLSGAADNGSDLNSKALNYVKEVVLSESNTLLAQPQTVVEGDIPILSVNDLPAGTTIGGETLSARMIALGMNFGAICKNSGQNMTEGGLKLWRNAVYELAGLSIPDTSTVRITFQVDMTNEIVSSSGVYLNGSFSDWNKGISTSVFGNTYTATLNLKKGDSIEYKFINGLPDDWMKYELLDGSCAHNGNRLLVVPDYDMVLDLVCFGHCTTCETLPASDSVSVTFRVDMSHQTVSEFGVQINGSFSNWSKAFHLNQSGDVFYGPINLKKGDSIQYKFVNGDDFDWDNYEIVRGACGFEGPLNRLLIVPEKDVILDPVFFGNCGTSVPIADAGNDKTVKGGTTVTLNGYESFDPDGDWISYSWEAPETVVLDNPTAADPSFVSPIVSSQIRLPFILTVSDGSTQSISDTVFITIESFTPVRVGYFTFQKTMDETATPVNYDPVFYVLDEDSLLEVTLNILTDASSSAQVDLTPYDVIVVQESFSSTAGILQPGAPLGFSAINKPFVYNKMYALKDGRALTNGSTGSGAEKQGSYAIVVNPALQGNDLFKGMVFDGDSVILFNSGANDDGSSTAYKALNYAKLVDLSDPNTLLAQPQGIIEGDIPILSVNDIPSGTTIGSETLSARMITLGMNFGAICSDYGTNLTREGLTLWRNAVYSLGGLAVPNTLTESSDSVNLMFQVDMSNETVTIDGVHLNGSYSDWTSPLKMSQTGNIFSTTLRCHKGDTIEYKFINGGGFDWAKYELLDGSCAYGTDKNRMIVVPLIDQILDPVCFSTCEACVIDPNRLVLRHSYTFEDGQATDVIGNANGTIMGGSVSDGSYQATQEGDYIVLPAQTIGLNTYSEITIEAFITAGYNENPDYTMLAYFGNSYNNLGTDFYYIQPTRLDDILRTAISCDNLSEPWSTESGVNGSELDDGTKHHIVSKISHDSIFLYLDGDFIGAEALTGNNAISGIGNQLAYLGKSGYTSDPTWRGVIHEFNIWEGSLPDSTIYRRGKIFLQGAYLTHSYPFSNGTAEDVIGGANGTLNGGSILNGLYTAASPGDYIELPANEIAINQYTNITLEAFVTTLKGANDGFSMLSYFGDSINTSGVNYLSMSIYREDNTSRTAISCGDIVSPWTSEDGVSGEKLDDSIRHHIVSTLSQSEISFYVDGEKIGSEELGGNNSISNLSNQLAFLCKSGYTNDPSWLGSINEFNIYEGLLDSSVIRQHALSFIANYEALATLYLDTDGDHWTNNNKWLSDAPYNEWFGLQTENDQVSVIDFGGLNNLIGYLPEELGQLTGLQVLNCSNNEGLTGSIPSSIGNLTALEELRLYNCNLTGTLPSELLTLTNLRIFEASYNNFDQAPMPDFGLLSNLEILTIEACNFTGPIPAGLGSLTNLDILYLGGNTYLDAGPMPDLSALNQLDILGLNACNRTGSIPAWLTQLTELKRIILDGNNLTGSIPTSFSYPEHIFELSLSDNSFTGSTLPDLTALYNLAILRLSRCNLTGTIPSWLGTLTDLQEIDLSNNQLSGTIPDNFNNLTDLGAINFSNNQLSGSIPLSLTTLPNLFSCVLNQNQLSGSIPDLSGMTNLSFLMLENNKFTFANLAGSLLLPADLSDFQYAPQDTTLGIDRDGNTLTALDCGHSNNLINWFDEANALGLNSRTITPTESGNYHFTVTNSSYPDLTLISDTVEVEITPVPENYQVSDLTLTTGNNTCFNATSLLTVAGDGTAVTLENGSSANFIAGVSIRYLPGFNARSGSYMHGYITTDGTFCNGLSAGLLANHPEDQQKSQEQTDQTQIFQSTDQEAAIKVYPNPSNGRFIIELTGLEGISKICLMNSLGSVVFETTASESQKILIENFLLSKGLYFVRVRKDNSELCRKIMIK